MKNETIKSISVKDTQIAAVAVNTNDCISLTDIARYKDSRNWLFKIRKPFTEIAQIKK